MSGHRKEVCHMSEVLELQLLADEQPEFELSWSTVSLFNCGNSD
jgi:hypothetical protein